MQTCMATKVEGLQLLPHRLRHHRALPIDRVLALDHIQTKYMYAVHASTYRNSVMHSYILASSSSFRNHKLHKEVMVTLKALNALFFESSIYQKLDL